MLPPITEPCTTTVGPDVAEGGGTSTRPRSGRTRFSTCQPAGTSRLIRPKSANTSMTARSVPLASRHAGQIDVARPADGAHVPSLEAGGRALVLHAIEKREAGHIGVAGRRLPLAHAAHAIDHPRAEDDQQIRPGLPEAVRPDADVVEQQPDAGNQEHRADDPVRRVGLQARRSGRAPRRRRARTRSAESARSMPALSARNTRPEDEHHEAEHEPRLVPPVRSRPVHVILRLAAAARAVRVDDTVDDQAEPDERRRAAARN